MGPSVAVLLAATADVIIGQRLPEPVRVDVSAGTRGSALDVEVATHVQLSAWSRVLGLIRRPWSSQPYVSNGSLCQLTNVYGRWRDARVRLHCLEPVDAIAVLRDEEPPW
ncbi:hypothetical protein [Phytohabitans kaempferiae]|uniref:Uncharacterized protein n=1 Tax=Phytohabitans kaempferiae TaxID=1620943 RepID=A0ABV6M6T0_9ACTN